MTPTIPGLTDLHQVGRGGFGVVYRAQEDRFGRQVAVKVIRESHLAANVLERFTRECRALGALSGHPNIVAVHDSGVTDEGEPYLVMEYLSGGSLAERVAEAGTVDAEQVVGWGVALAGALETAHRAGIVHRDVKPENVLFSAMDAPKIVDFGIARMRSAYETRSGSISLTLSHGSPESIAGAPITARSDVYSLASVLFYALAGRGPFDRPGETSLAPLIARISTQDPPDLRELGVPDVVASVIEHGLAKEPDARPASAEDFGTELQDAAGSTGFAVPDLPVARDRKSARAAKAGAAAVAALDAADLAATAETPRNTVHAAGRRDAVLVPIVADEPAVRSRRMLTGVAIGAVLLIAAASGTAYVLTSDDTPTHPRAGGGASTSAQSNSTSASSSGAVSSPASSPKPGRTSTRPKTTRTAGPVGGVVGGGGDPGPVGGVVVITQGGSVRTVTSPASHHPTSPRPPSISFASRTFGERTTVSVPVTVSDPNGAAVSLSVSGAPLGVGLSGHTLYGTISADAVQRTTNYRSLAAASFTVTVTATDTLGQRASRSVTWTVRDTHRTMPNYYGKYGCNGQGGCRESVPNVNDLSPHDGTCTTSGSFADSVIVGQSVRAGTIIRWGNGGVVIVYTYHHASC